MWRIISLIAAVVFACMPVGTAFAQLGGVVPPPADTTPPLISGVLTSSLLSASAAFAWTTSELAVSTFAYGTTMSYGSSASVSTGLAIGGVATLTGLLPSTTYYYCIHAADASNNSSQSCGNFATPAAPDLTPPVISLAVAVATNTSATITWTTSEQSDAQVVYGTSASYGSSSSLDSTLALTHSVMLTGLTPSTTYHYQIKSKDAAGNLATTQDATFTTGTISVSISTPADTIPPVISGVSETSLLSSEATIIWTTNELATSTIRWGTTTNYGSAFALNASAGLTHTATLLGLSPNTTYYYCIDATDLAGNMSNSCGHSFTTGSAPITPDTTPPAISDVASVSLEPHDATIGWTTDEIAVSTLEYGTTSFYGSSAALSASALLSHAAELTGLQANTTYYYCIHATDLAGNVSNSCGHSFTTAANEIVIDTNPPTISLITVAPITTSSATIGWTSDEIAGGYVEYGTTIGYGSETSFDTNLALTHEATLTGLSPDTEYHYRIHSRDEAGNTVITPDETFTTQSLPVISTPSDTTPPSINNVGAGSISSTIATLSWTTSELAVSTLEYGTTQSYGSSAELSASALLAHDATLVGLSPHTTYYYCIHATDLAGNRADSCGHSFMTGAPPLVLDTTAPSVSGVVVSSITDSSSSVHWTSGESANSQVEYGLTTSYGSETPIEPELNLSGSAALSDLSPDTTYHLRVRGYDSSGNVGLSGDYTFTTGSTGSPQAAPTSGTSPNAAPIISGVGADAVGETSATVNWTTDVPADSTVEYGNSENLGSSAYSQTLTTSHVVTLGGLTSDTNYQFRVISRTNGNAQFQTTSSLREFATLAVPVVVDSPANITSASAISNDTTAIISFTIDAAAHVGIEYGLDTSYGSDFPSSDWNTSGMISLSNLQPASTYHFRVRVIDAGDNVTYSQDHTFMTSGVASLSGTSSAPEIAVPATPESTAHASTTEPVPNIVTAEGSDSQIEFSWRNPQTDDFADTVIVRNDTHYPASPVDGEVIYQGPRETFTDTALSNGSPYFYSLYSYGAVGGYSQPIHVSTSPKKGVNEIKMYRNAALEHALSTEHFTQDLRLGDQSLEVEHLQQILNVVELHDSKLTTGYFGALTETSLKKFQAQNNLPQTGVADEATRAALDAISDGWTLLNAPNDIADLDHDLKRGDSEEDVGDLQEFLAFEGSYPDAIISNYFGGKTQNGVKNFQESYGVTPVSGYVGYKTRHTIQTVLGL